MTKESISLKAKEYASSMMLCHPMEREDYEYSFLKGAMAMDEYAASYAKQQAIAFAEYVSNVKTSQQLYNQFIEQQNKDNGNR